MSFVKIREGESVKTFVAVALTLASSNGTSLGISNFQVSSKGKKTSVSSLEINVIVSISSFVKATKGSREDESVSVSLGQLDVWYQKY